MGHGYSVIGTLTFATMGSYVAYILYWFVKSFLWIVDKSLRPEYYTPPAGLRFWNPHSVSVAYLMEYSGFFGLMARVVVASYALFSVFLILKTETNFFPAVRDKISRALCLEGFCFLSFIP
jgi:hypothetical protein